MKKGESETGVLSSFVMGVCYKEPVVDIWKDKNVLKSEVGGYRRHAPGEHSWSCCKAEWKSFELVCL